MKKYINNKVKIFTLPFLMLLLLAPASMAQVPRTGKEAYTSVYDSLPASEKVVDVAYGKQSYDGVTGSISTVYSDELRRVTAQNTSDALFGRLPGLTIVKIAGEPGATGAYYRVRGQNTYNNGTPLMLVDGFRTDIEQLSIYEIESVSVLKDASALALYGQEAANGVILITTKRGIAGKTTIDVNANFGMQQITKWPDLLNAREYATLFNQALENDGLPAKYSQEDIDRYGMPGVAQYTHPDNNYLKALMKDFAPMANAGVNINGGSERVRYMVTLGYMHNGGLYKNAHENDYSTQTRINRFNLRSNLDIKITDKLSAQVDMSGRIDNRFYPGVGADQMMNTAFIPPQEFPLRNPDGSLGGTTDYTYNPLGLITSTGYQNTIYRNLDMTLRMKYEFDGKLEGLSLGATGSMMNFMYLADNKTRRFNVFSIASHPGDDDPNGEYTYTQIGNNSDALGWGTGVWSEQRLNLELNANYSRVFGDHSLNAMLMYHQDRYMLSDDYYKFNNAGFGFRGHYGYKGRYFGEITASYYGQEQYRPGHRFGLFYGVGGSWILSQENFLKNSDAVNYLKLRASYGKIGGESFPINAGGGAENAQTRIFWKQYYAGAPNSNFGATGSTGYMGRVEGIMASPNVTWDKSYIGDVSVEATLFDHVNVMFNYFWDVRKDILTTNSNNIAGAMGRSGEYTNDGEVKNHGFETTLEYFGRSGDFEYSVQGGFSFAKNEYVNQPNELKYPYPYLSVEGKSIGVPRVYVADGFYTQEEIDAIDRTPAHPFPTFGIIQPGDVKYKDLDGNGVIDDLDQAIMGYSALPQITYSVGLNLKYKNVYLYAWGQGIANSEIMLDGYYRPFYDRRNAYTYAKNSWTPETAATATLPRLSTQNNTNNFRNSTVWVRSADFFKLRNLEIGYHLPQKVLNAINFKDAKVYLRGQDLFTTAKDLDFVDPEATWGGSPRPAYPTTRLYSIGVNIFF